MPSTRPSRALWSTGASVRPARLQDPSHQLRRDHQAEGREHELEGPAGHGVRDRDSAGDAEEAEGAHDEALPQPDVAVPVLAVGAERRDEHDRHERGGLGRPPRLGEEDHEGRDEEKSAPPAHPPSQHSPQEPTPPPPPPPPPKPPPETPPRACAHLLKKKPAPAPAPPSGAAKSGAPPRGGMRG